VSKAYFRGQARAIAEDHFGFERGIAPITEEVLV